MSKIITYTDGGARGNPGHAGVGIVIKQYQLASSNYQEDGEAETIYSHGEYIGETTNNQAEYAALIKAFEWILSSKLLVDEIECRLDSELVVRQLIGQYKVKDPGMREMFGRVKELMDKIGQKIIFVHVRREQNKEADLLVNQAIDEYMNNQ